MSIVEEEAGRMVGEVVCVFVRIIFVPQGGGPSVTCTAQDRASPNVGVPSDRGMKPSNARVL